MRQITIQLLARRIKNDVWYICHDRDSRSHGLKVDNEVVGYQQNRVPHFHSKTTHQDKYYDPRPITAGLGLTLLKTKAKGQAPEPPSAPLLRLTPLHLVKGARPLCTATASLNPPTVTHRHGHARAPIFFC
jgi:hypothetical protein